MPEKEMEERMDKRFQHRTLRERAADFDGQLNLSEEVEWGEPRGDEMW